MKKSIEIHLYLDEDEAKWLKAIMQNPMFVDDPSEEEQMDNEMRRRFWNALSEVKS